MSAVRNLNNTDVGGRPLRIDLADSDPFLEGKTTVRGELIDGGVVPALLHILKDGYLCGYSKEKLTSWSTEAELSQLQHKILASVDDVFREAHHFLSAIWGIKTPFLDSQPILEVKAADSEILDGDLVCQTIVGVIEGLLEFGTRFSYVNFYNAIGQTHEGDLHQPGPLFLPL